MKKLSLALITLAALLNLAGGVWALTPSTSPISLPTPTPVKVDYFLVYPGILPDHFLYSVKMVRDRVLMFLTVDPVKKAELLLLYADKRLGAGKALIEGGKVDLGVSTITKAEKYLEQAVNQEKIASQSNKETSVLREKMTRAIDKHEEVILQLMGRVSGTTKSTLEEALEYPKKLR